MKSKRDIGQEILEGIREIKAFKAGQGNLRTFKLNSAEIRDGQHLRAAELQRGRFERTTILMRIMKLKSSNKRSDHKGK